MNYPDDETEEEERAGLQRSYELGNKLKALLEAHVREYEASLGSASVAADLRWAAIDLAANIVASTEMPFSGAVQFFAQRFAEYEEGITNGTATLRHVAPQSSESPERQ